jgi:uncharacterized protein YcbK (DUF882 family)
MTQKNKNIIIGSLLLIFLLMRKKTSTLNVPNTNINCNEPKGKYFKLSEFHSKDGVKVPQDLYCNLQKLIDNLDVLRDELKSTIRINSGYRSPQHNKNVGGVSNSYHLKAMAADIAVSGYTPSQVKQTIEKLIKSGKMKQGGIGLYNTFVHYDIGNKASRWNG